MATLLAKVQLGDNRHVDLLVIEYWHDTIGDLPLEAALAALKRFRRERPGVYLEPGHLLELAGVVDERPDSLPDVTGHVIAESRRRALEAAGVTEEEYSAHEHDIAWLRAKFPVGRDELAPAGFDDEDAPE
jgi:hypothetical protein